MQKRNNCFVPLAAGFLSACLCFSPTSVFAASKVLKQGTQSIEVTKLQKDLGALGFFKLQPTGYFGNETREAVVKFQARYGLERDGKVGKDTIGLIGKLLHKNVSATKISKSSSASKKSLASRGEKSEKQYLVPWFGRAEDIFGKSKVALIYDIKTGMSFKAKRTYGYNHADCEALTAEDASIMKKIYNGKWSWKRRAVIVTIDGQKMAASMAGMPHAGNDKLPDEELIKWRSGGYGPGINLDEVKGNAMDGHFDIHFLGSRTHGTNRVDAEHQRMVKKAAEWAQDNY